jgi:hypothetical protein
MHAPTVSPGYCPACQTGPGELHDARCPTDQARQPEASAPSEPCSADELRRLDGILHEAANEGRGLRTAVEWRSTKASRSDVMELLAPAAEEIALFAEPPGREFTLRNEGAAIRLLHALIRESARRWPMKAVLSHDDFEFNPTPGSQFAYDLKALPSVRRKLGAAAELALLDLAYAYALALAEHPL